MKKKSLLPNLMLCLILIPHSLTPQLSVLPVDVNCSIRGLSVADDNTAWFSGTNGTVGISTDGGKSWTITQLKGFEQNDFRTIYAFNEQEAIVAGTGSPAYILRTEDGGASWKPVYRNDNPLIFIDGADFWDKNNGILYGDPIDGRMLLLTTSDGGRSWKELPAESRPRVSAGEASFAASGTGIRCYGKKRTVMATGGTVSRILISKDRAYTWKALLLPVLQGKETTGAFSVAFFGKKKAVVVGGDYSREDSNRDHVFYTKDAGNHWYAPELSTGGFRECVLYIDKKTVMAIGPGGSDFSSDGGKSWKPLSGEKGFHVITKARTGKLVLAAGNKKIALVLPEKLK